MGVPIAKAAAALGVSRKILSKIVNTKSGLSPESWMVHQVAYDLWQVELRADELNLSPLPV